MSDANEYSANEIAALVLKAARGGDIPLGHAEDLARATKFLDFDQLKDCPCSGPDPAAVFVPIALDLVAADQGAQVVKGDAVAIEAMVALYETHVGRKLVWAALPDGARFERFEEGTVAHSVMGRRHVPEPLMSHLIEMAAKTYVPETEESRALGAGAGLTDND